MTKFLNISTDNTLGGDSPSDENVASQKAIKEYVDSQSGGGTSYSAGDGIVIASQLSGYSTVGTVEFYDGVLVAASVYLNSSNYVYKEISNIDTSKPFKYVTKLNFGAYLSQGAVIDLNNGSGKSALYVGWDPYGANGALRLYASSNGTSFDIANGVAGSTYIYTNSTKFIETGWDGSKYYVKLSNDGQTWGENEIEVSSSTPIHAWNRLTFGYCTGNGSGEFMGECDFNVVHFEEIGGVVWNPLSSAPDANTISVEILQGSTPPTTSTIGYIGEHYTDTTTGRVYVCTAIDSSTYTWKEIQTTANLVTSLSSASTDTQYPSAKCVYDFVESQSGGDSDVYKSLTSAQETTLLENGTYNGQAVANNTIFTRYDGTFQKFILGSSVSYDTVSSSLYGGSYALTTDTTIVRTGQLGYSGGWPGAYVGYSEDGGQSFSISTLDGNDFDSNENDLRCLCAGKNSEVYGLRCYSNLYHTKFIKSTDGGKTFTSSTVINTTDGFGFIGYLKASDVIVAIPLSSGYAKNETLYSTDGGQTFQEFNTYNTYGTTVYRIGKLDDDTIIILASDGKVYTTTSWTTWTQIGTFSLSGDQWARDWNWRTTITRVGDYLVFRGSFNGGKIAYSDDEGESWALTQNDFPEIEGCGLFDYASGVYVCVKSGTFYTSTDLLSGWESHSFMTYSGGADYGTENVSNLVHLNGKVLFGSNDGSALITLQSPNVLEALSYNKTEVDNILGDIETALNTINSGASNSNTVNLTVELSGTDKDYFDEFIINNVTYNLSDFTNYSMTISIPKDTNLSWTASVDAGSSVTPSSGTINTSTDYTLTLSISNEGGGGHN